MKHLHAALALIAFMAGTTPLGLAQKVLSAPRPNWGAALRQGWGWFKMDSNEGRVKCENNLLKL